MAKYNFCTLFDVNYILQGIILYESLKRHCPDFHLYVFAFDRKTEEILRKEQLEHLTVIGLSDFENERLLAVKKSRSKGEYCWTCSSSTIQYVLANYSLPSCTYIDADLCFWSNPGILIDDMKDSSVLIVPHRYDKKFEYLEPESGRYCVQFVTIKNDENGLRALNWWVDKCIEWCYSRVENGKFGDQKYLDYWPIAFAGIQEVTHEGAGLAPWNINTYKLEHHFAINRNTAKSWEIIFYHFHGTKFCSHANVYLTGNAYDLSKQVIDKFYKEYISFAYNVYSNYLIKYENVQLSFFQNKPSYNYISTLKYELKLFVKTFFCLLVRFLKIVAIVLLYDKLKFNRYRKFE